MDLSFLKGWKTVVFGLVLACAPAALTYLAGIDWTHIIGPNAAFFVSGLIVLGLRAVTTTSIGKK